MEPKQVDFSVIKQKIIKTDEILKMYSESNKKLKKTQQAYKDLKSKYDEVNSGFSRLELENGRCTFNLQQITSKHDKLELECKQTLQQKVLLEQKYSRHIVECQSTILELQDELRMMKELSEGAEKLSSPPRKKVSPENDDSSKKINEMEEHIKYLKESEATAKKKLELERKEFAEGMNKIKDEHSKVIQLSQGEKLQLSNDLNKMKLQITSNQTHYNENLHAKDKEISKLNAEVLALRGLKEQLKHITEENKKLNNDILCQSRERCTVPSKTAQTQTTEDFKSVLEENFTLRREIQLYKSQTSKSEWTQTESVDSEDESLMDILEAMAGPPRLLSPMRHSPYRQSDDEAASLVQQNEIPTIIVTPCTPVINKEQKFEEYPQGCEEDKQGSFTPEVYETKAEIIDGLSVENICDNIIQSDVTSLIALEIKTAEEETQSNDCPAGVDNDIPTDKSEEKKILACDLDENHLMDDSSEDQQNQVNQNVNQPNIETFKEVEHQPLKIDPDIIDSKVQTPAESVESNSHKWKSKIPGRRKYRHWPNLNGYVKLHRGKPPLNKKEPRRKLGAKKYHRKDCVLRALQVLKRSKINFTISNESTVPLQWRDYNFLNRFENGERVGSPKQNVNHSIRKLSCPSKICRSACMSLDGSSCPAKLLGFFDVKQESVTPLGGEPLDKKPGTPLRWLNNLPISEITSENVLDRLAELVSEKLKNDKNLKRKRTTCLPQDSEFCSETETELERLIEEPSCDVLERNKMLLKKAKYDRSREKTSQNSLEGNDAKSNIETPVFTDRYLKNQHLKAETVYPNVMSPMNPKQKSPMAHSGAKSVVRSPFNESFPQEDPTTVTSDVSEEISDIEDSTDFCKFSPVPILLSPIKSSPKSSPKTDAFTISPRNKEINFKSSDESKLSNTCKLKHSSDLLSTVRKIDKLNEPLFTGLSSTLDIGIEAKEESSEANCKLKTGAPAVGVSNSTPFNVSKQRDLEKMGCSSIVGLFADKNTKNETSSLILQPQSPVMYSDSIFSSHTKPFREIIPGKSPDPDNTFSTTSNCSRSFELLDSLKLLQNLDEINQQIPCKNIRRSISEENSSLPSCCDPKENISNKSSELEELEPVCAANEMEKSKIDDLKQSPLSSDDSDPSTSFHCMETQELDRETNYMNFTPRILQKIENNSANSNAVNNLNTSSCISEFLSNEKEMTKEIDRFMTRFQLNQSLTETQSFQQERSSDTILTASDILNIMSYSENAQKSQEPLDFSNSKNLEELNVTTLNDEEERLSRLQSSEEKSSFGYASSPNKDLSSSQQFKKEVSDCSVSLEENYRNSIKLEEEIHNWPESPENIQPSPVKFEEEEEEIHNWPGSLENIQPSPVKIEEEEEIHNWPESPENIQPSPVKFEEEEVLSCPQSPDVCPAPLLSIATKIIPLERVDDVAVRKKKTKMNLRRSRRLSKAIISSSSEHESENEICERLRASETISNEPTEAAVTRIRRKSLLKETVPPEKVVRKRGRPKKYLLKQPPEELESKQSRIESDPPEDIDKEKTEVPDVNEGNGINSESTQLSPMETKKVVKKKQKMSKLKANVMRQMKQKQQMYQSDKPAANFDCRLETHVKKNDAIEASVGNENETVPAEPSNSQNKVSSGILKKINIVQNILIQAGHGAPSVDLQGRYIGDSNPQQKSSETIKEKPPKKCARSESCDILSQIMCDMDKGRPKCVPKPIAPKKNLPQDLVDKQWRKGILDVAEIMYNREANWGETYGLQYCNDKNNVGILKRGMTLPIRIRVLLKKLMETTNENEIPHHVIAEFKKMKIEIIVDIIIHEVSKDFCEKPDTKHFPAPLMTKTQRMFLALMLKLEQENVENLTNRFLFKTKFHVFKTGCGLKATIPLTRLFLGVCRIRGDIQAMRMFCCEAFFYIGDKAVPLLFAVLTSWSEVIPMEADANYYPMAKVLVQLVHLKTCNKPGYNLLPLRCLLHQFYGYPKERSNCDTFFEEVCQEYLRNPSPASDFAIRLYCRNKDTKWVYKKINEFFKPLIYKIPTENVNFKATAILLLGKICRQFRPKEEHDEACLAEMNRFFAGLMEDDLPELVKQSVHLSLNRLPQKRIKIPPTEKKCANDPPNNQTTGNGKGKAMQRNKNQNRFINQARKTVKRKRRFKKSNK
ncbi:uncharacterized protein isoform X1 [Leptinotarsa decemlineata]|uniref:uncharacterized protein isoform X1 n=1 Tax=Leptinotarsa decemlineata TaxID=7539 RepID=UPI003D307CFB